MKRAALIIALLCASRILLAQTCPSLPGEIINGTVKAVVVTGTAASLAARAAQLLATGWAILGVGGTATAPTILASCAVTATPPATPSSGFAARYPKDVGISTHPAVVFDEEFDDTIAAVISRWTSHVERTSYISSDVPPGSVAGSRSIAMPHTTADTGAQFFKGFPTNYDELYVRFYLKPTAHTNHSGVWIGGENVGAGGPLWPDGHAGSKPCRVANGECATRMLAAWFWTSAEHDQSDFVNSYTAYLNMRPDSGGTYWGNQLAANKTAPLPFNAWTCLEHRVKMNRVGDTDGELSIWVNNAPLVALRKGAPSGTWMSSIFTPGAGAPFDGLEWRDTTAFGVNYIWLQNYSEGIPPNTVWYDHVVVATQRIGCMVP